MHYVKGEICKLHYHKIATEYNVLIYGRIVVDGTELVAGDAYIVRPNEVSDLSFLEDSCIAVVKVPSIPDDKWEIP